MLQPFAALKGDGPSLDSFSGCVHQQDLRGKSKAHTHLSTRLVLKPSETSLFTSTSAAADFHISRAIAVDARPKIDAWGSNFSFPISLDNCPN